MKNRFLNYVYLTNADYDSLERESRHHILIHVFILILAMCGLLPMVLNVTNNIDTYYSSLAMLVICVMALALFRIPYLCGKLNHFGK